MTAPQRYSAEVSLFDGALTPAVDGPVVLFSDVEEALQDSARLAWLMPVFSGEDSLRAKQRSEALAAGLSIGLNGIALVDWAMEGTPS